MHSLLKSVFGLVRQFSSYDECPKIYIRFNGQKEYGPHKLHDIVDYKGFNPNAIVEARFSDESEWRPQKYFVNLWETIPVCAFTTKRLTNERIPIRPGMSEPEARRLLAECAKSKPPTARQLQRLQEYGVPAAGIESREKAKELIAEQVKIDRAKEEKAARAVQKVEEAPQMAQCRERLAELRKQVEILVGEWRTKEPEELSAFLQYLELVEEALDYAQAFDIDHLHGGPFYDPVNSRDYYLEIERNPTDHELRTFQGSIFLGYVRNGSDKFGHLKLLRKSLPSVIATPLCS
jgi:hypothetical protein